MTSRYFDLTTKEKRLEWALLALFGLLVLIIGTGLYTQRNGLDYDRYLAFLLFAIGAAFFLLLGWNGLANGNLIHKWMPPVIHLPLRFVIKHLKTKEQETINKTTANVLGVIGIITGAICFVFALDVVFDKAFLSVFR